MIGQSVGSDASPLSCFLFRPRKSREKRRKRSHTNVSNALVRTSRLSQTLLQTPLPCFPASINEYYTAKNGLGTIAPRLLSQVKVGTHSAFGEGSHTRAHTPKHGVFWVGALSLPSDCFTRFGNPAWPGVRTAYFAAFGSWPGVLRRTQRASGQRCAYARRCPEASRPRWAA